MLRFQVTPETLQRLTKEASGDRRGFIRRMLGRTRNEDPYFAQLITLLANLAETEFTEKGSAHAKEIEELVFEVGMYCFRSLELAQIEGRRIDEAKTLNDALMRDPDASASTSEGREANDEMREIINKLRQKK